MSLYEIWKENPAQIREKRVDQIIGFAGDGKLATTTLLRRSFARSSQGCLRRSWLGMPTTALAGLSPTQA